MTYYLPQSALSDYLELSEPIAVQKDFETDIDSADVSGFIQQNRSEIRSVLGADTDGWPVEILVRLMKIVEIGVHSKRASETQWALLNEICSAMKPNTYCVSLSNEHAWKKVLSIASKYIGHTRHQERLTRNGRTSSVGHAILKLEQEGYEFQLDGFGPRPTDKSYKRICTRIENKIRRVGGEKAAKFLLDLLKQSGRVHDDSLMHARATSMLNEKSHPSTPWHYIYALCLKHLSTKPTSSRPDRDLNNMIKLATNFVSCIDVETYSTFENLDISRFDLFRVMRDTLLYDELFALPQWQGKSARFLVPEWLNSLDAEGVCFPLVSKKIWSRVFERLYSFSDPCGLVPIEPVYFIDREFSEGQIDTIFKALSLRSKQINRSYYLPSENQHKNYHFFPVFEVAPQRYVLQPRAMMARAFCERLFTLLREAKEPDLNNKMGFALERLTSSVLKKFGAIPSIENGEYPGDIKNEKREMDVVVETPKRIFLFECTKKTLKASSRRGDELSTLADLEGSFIKLLQQLSRHEERLVRDGEIKLVDGRELNHDKRPIEKIGVSLFDHGSIQSRDFTMPLINTLVNVELDSDKVQDQEILKKINKRLASINKSINQIVTTDEENTESWAFHKFQMSTWWLSIDQLYYLCEVGGDLWQGLLPIRHLTARSGDPVYEVLRSRNLNKLGQALFDQTKKMDNRAIL